LVVEVKGTLEEIAQTLKRLGVDLTPEEACRIRDRIGRDPTVTELFIFDIMWSEHCSYKSSKRVLQEHLPTEGSRVILGPGEDAGVVRLATVGEDTYVLVVAHESHNHPSQILPVEGAATGIGGIVRDVYCMGADVIGVMDALRFGDPEGPRSENVKEIIEGVVRGIWEYGNALGVPNTGGDVFFDRDYDENCLVNVIAMGLAREDEIVRSRVPSGAAEETYDLILVGKPTDRSGLGGATMASRILDEERTSDLGAVQLHDPFLKRMLAEATASVLSRARGGGIEVGFKDLGAGGIACAVSEIVDRGGFGARIDLDKVNVAFNDIESFAIACSETQERYCWAVPADFTETVLGIYNDDYELPHVYRGAGAVRIGRVTPERDVVMTRGGETVAELPAPMITEGITYDREAAPPRTPHQGAGRSGSDSPDTLPRIDDLKSVFLSVLSLSSICSKHYIYRHYDSEVKGMSALKPGEADACVTVIPGTPVGIATSVDGNPRYSRVDPYWGGVMAVCESVRNIAAVGAVPIALTDCLNFGNPEDPRVFGDFIETVRGIGDAARALCAFGTDEALPVVSGNVSFYNESSSGAAIPPSPVVACYGVLDDYSVAASLALKHSGSRLLMIGSPGRGLAGSALLDVLGLSGTGMPPRMDLEAERKAAHAVTGAIRSGLVTACHDVSEGGLLVALAEMVIGGWSTGRKGACIDLDFGGDAPDVDLLFSEAGGYIVEVAPESIEAVINICENHGAFVNELGRTVDEQELEVRKSGRTILKIGIDEIGEAWSGALEKLVR
jgi:phosphoribosylformylglycinamidine synthase